MAFPWAGIIQGASSILGNAQAQKLESSRNARDLAIANANILASTNQTQQITKMVPLAIMSLGAILVVALLFKK